MIKAALSYFHRKIGPLVFYSFPEDTLEDKLSSRIANIMDQQFTEGFFTHSFEEIITLNYYFEIQSEWARGNKDMLMISIIFDRQITLEIEENIQNLCIEFSEKLKSNEDIYTAFHISDLNNFNQKEQEIIINNNEVVTEWVKELYWASNEVTKEKTEEEKLANLLKKKHIFLTLRKLSKGPLPLEWLREWFYDNFPDKNYEEMMDVLVERQLLFINQIGIVEKYVLLLKEVNAERIPPDSVITYIDETPELIDLILPKVQEYFSRYETKTKEELEEDAFLLFQIISDPKKYNILSELRSGLISRKDLSELVSKRNLDTLSEVILFLKDQNIIEELEYNDEKYIILKTNLQVTTAFPEYLRKLLPQEAKPVVVSKEASYGEEEEKQKEIAKILRDARRKKSRKTREEKISDFLEDLAKKPVDNSDLNDESN